VIVGFAVSPLLSVVVLVTFGSFLLVTRVLALRSRRLGRDWHRAFTRFSSGVRVALRTMSLTQSSGAERWEVERRTNEIDHVAGLASRFGSAQADYMAAVGVLAGLIGTLILLVGGERVSSGDMSLGDLIAFYAIGALVLRQLAVAAPATVNAQAGAEALVRIEELLATDVEQPYTGTTVIEPGGALELRRVTFGYGSELVLVDVDLELRRGEHVALVGPSGSGKSTLVSLLIGLYAPGAGQVVIDGVPLDDVDVTALRQRIGVVLQDPVIVPGTIAENIAYGSGGVSQDEIEAAARAAAADAFIESLPERYETQVGDEGVRLSGGQRQQIAVARALVGTPALLILDEPTTYLDQEAIVALMHTLDSLPWSPTLVIVTHDPMVAEHADRIVQVRGGQVVGEAPGGLAGARLAN
jgi:ATP-binding cassette subfamily B protein